MTWQMYIQIRLMCKVFCRHFGQKWSCYQDVQLCSYLFFTLICHDIKWLYPWDHISITAYCYIWKIHEGIFRKVWNPFMLKFHHLIGFAIQMRNIQSMLQRFLCWTNAIISLPSWEMKQQPCNWYCTEYHVWSGWNCDDDTVEINEIDWRTVLSSNYPRESGHG